MERYRHTTDGRATASRFRSLKMSTYVVRDGIYEIFLTWNNPHMSQEIIVLTKRLLEVYFGDKAVKNQTCQSIAKYIA